MLDSRELLEHAERCSSLAELTRMPEVASRLRVLAQRYREQARAQSRDIKEAPSIAPGDDETSIVPE